MISNVFLQEFWKPGGGGGGGGGCFWDLWWRGLSAMSRITGNSHICSITCSCNQWTKVPKLRIAEGLIDALISHVLQHLSLQSLPLCPLHFEWNSRYFEKSFPQRKYIASGWTNYFLQMVLIYVCCWAQMQPCSNFYCFSVDRYPVTTKRHVSQEAELLWLFQ